MLWLKASDRQCQSTFREREERDSRKPVYATAYAIWPWGDNTYADPFYTVPICPTSTAGLRKRALPLSDQAMDAFLGGTARRLLVKEST